MNERNPHAPNGDWSPDEFREAGLAAIEWVARYLERLPELPVVPPVAPGDIAAQIPASPPEDPEPFDRLLRDLDEIVVPGVTHWNHPGFLAYFGITGSGPGILGELVASAFNTNGMLWKSSPSTTEVELAMMGWLRDMLDLPSDWFGMLTDTASMSTFLALAAARESVEGMDVRREGLAAPGYPRLRVYASDQAHSSAEKACIGLGLGQVGFVKIPVDAEFRMRADVLAEQVAQDRAAGWRPLAVVATIGTTSTTSIDPVPEIADICERESLWLHVDGAYAGAAAVLPEMRDAFRGLERADSYVMNPHKWLFVPIDASAFFTRHGDVLRRAFQLVPDYLHTTDDAVNLMDYGLQLGRRFRAIKLWWVLRTFGVNGIRERIRSHCRLAQLLAGWIEEDDRFEVAAPVPFSTVCFRGRWPDCDESELDRRNELLAERVTRSGIAFLAHTRLEGRITIRAAIGNLRTDTSRIESVWRALQSTHDEITRVGATSAQGESR